MNEVYREIERYVPDLQKYSRVLTRNPSVADDLVQESIVRALSKSHLYKEGTNLRAWLFTVMHNQHVSGLRRSRREGIPVDPDKVPSATASRPKQEIGLVLKSVIRAFRMLPEEQRTLLKEASIDGKSYRELAATHGLALGTVKSRVSRGRSFLRKAVEGVEFQRAA